MPESLKEREAMVESKADEIGISYVEQAF